jgi:hypothetical protein
MKVSIIAKLARIWRDETRAHGTFDIYGLGEKQYEREIDLEEDIFKRITDAMIKESQHAFIREITENKEFMDNLTKTIVGHPDIKPMVDKILEKVIEDNILQLFKQNQNRY